MNFHFPPWPEFSFRRRTDRPPFNTHKYFMYNISSSSSCFFLLIFPLTFFKLFKSRSEGERRGKRHGGRRLFSSSSVARFQFHQRIRDDTHSFSHLRRRRFLLLLLSSSKEINLLVTFFHLLLGCVPFLSSRTL